MEGKIIWDSGLKFRGMSGTGHTINIDAPEIYGGTNTAPSPMEYLLLGTAGCTAHDVVSILTKRRKEIKNLEVEIKSVRKEEHPKVFTSFTMHFKVFGEKISAKDVEKALGLSEEKYCSATAMIGKTAQINTSFEIISSDE